MLDHQGQPDTQTEGFGKSSEFEDQGPSLRSSNVCSQGPLVDCAVCCGLVLVLVTLTPKLNKSQLMTPGLANTSTDPGQGVPCTIAEEALDRDPRFRLKV